MGGDSSKPNFKEPHENELAKKYEPKKQWEAHQLGLKHPDRGCTDILCIVLFAACWALMWLVASTAFANGDPKRLIYGKDALGNLCGQSKDPGVNISITGAKWSDLTSTVYPFPSASECASGFLYGKTCEDRLQSALNLGVCVKECPGVGQRVTWYNGGQQITSTDGTPIDVGFEVKLDLKKSVHRCIPADLTVFQNASVALLEQLDIAGTLSSGIRVLDEGWPVMLISFGFCIFACFFWLFVLRCTVKPTVVVSLFLLWVGLALIAYFLYNTSQRSEGDMGKLWLALSIVSAVLWLVYTLLLCFFCKNINVACDVIEEASKIPIKIKTMPLVPPVVTLCLAPVFAYHAIVAVYIQTSGDFDNTTVTVLDHAQGGPGATAANTTADLVKEVFESTYWKDYAHIWNLFMFLWTMGIVETIGYLTLAFCAVFWYWSAPGGGKEPQAGVMRGFCYTLRYHVGTIIFGSLIIAIIQVIRFIMKKFEDRMRKISDNQMANCLVKCVQCCLLCFERLIKFINKNAYIMTAMCSDSFCSGARRALFLLLRHAFSVLAVSVIGDWVIFFGKLQIVLGTTAVGWVLLTQTDIAGEYAYDEMQGDMLVVLIVIAIVAFLIASIFCEVFGVCVDTVLLSFCHDLDVNDGSEEKPYYLPPDLQRSLGHKNETEMYKKMGS